MGKKKETILVFGAHSDDFVIGAGGTIANYTQQGKQVLSIVLSYGENSHVWLKEKVIQKMRAHEALEASKLLGCKTYIFDLKENYFEKEFKEKQLEKKILGMIKTLKPTKKYLNFTSWYYYNNYQHYYLLGGLGLVFLII